MAGGLAPVGSRSGPNIGNCSLSVKIWLNRFTTASQPNGGKPPRHKNLIGRRFLAVRSNPDQQSRLEHRKRHQTGDGET
ncbi:hypothetical protein C1884_12200 [Pseudomonas sp. GW460-R15]|nr:hypothetical protein C1884_12200 [Pseudomonas sp. GW460-R15]